MTLLGITGLVNFLTSASIGLFTLLNNPKQTINRAYCYGNSAIAIYSFGYFFWQSTNNHEAALFWFKFLVVGIILINTTYLHFVFAFTGNLDRKKKELFLYYAISSIFIILNFTSLLYKDIEPRFNLGFWPTPSLFFHIYLLFWFWQCFYGFIILIRCFKDSVGLKREQLKYFTLAASIGFIGGGTNWLMWYRIYFPPYTNILISFYVAIIAYAILRYHLMNINVALTRAGLFIVVYGLVLGIPFWIGSATKSWFTATALAVVLATLGPFIYSYLRRHAEQILLREQHRYQAVLRELAKTMIRIRDLDQLSKMVLSTVVDTVKISSGAIYLRDELQKAFVMKHYLPKTAKYNFPELIPLDSVLVDTLNTQRRPLLYEELGDVGLSPESASLTVPSIIENNILAFMLLGTKSDNQMFTTDDVLIFETVSYSTSLAIENCHFWKEIEDRQRKARLQEMDTYSYSLAHEIDNPMQVVIGQTDLLQKYMLKELNPPPEKQLELKESFDYILEAARRVSGMVKAIRDFGQATTGELKPLKMEDVIESFAKLYYPQFKANSINFQKTIPEGLGFVRGEKPELMQVLVILANNALHAMRYSREKKISLKAERFQNEQIKLSFKDSGCGVKKELLPIIFAPFTTTKASSEGTGMGLYNAQKIINRHKGKIWVESEGENRGATFFIELPVAQDLSEEDFKKDDNDKKLF